MERLYTRQTLSIIAAIVFVAAALPAASASVTFGEGESVTLAELEDGAEILVGDQLFSGFEYNPVGDAPSADEVAVTGFIDAFGDVGLLFSGPFATFGSPALGPSSIEAGLLFNVEIVDPGFVFDSVTLAGTVGIGDEVGFGSIEETIVAGPDAEGFGLGINNIVVDGEQGPEVTADTVVFDDDSEFTQLTVVKDLLLTVGVDPGPFDSALLTSFTQVFGQRPTGEPVVPEPAAITIAAVGCLSILRRRRRA